LTILALPVLVPSIIITFSLQAYWRMLFDVGALTLLLLVAFVPQLGFRLRVVIFFGISYITSTAWLVISGLPGNGRVFFVVVVVLAALLLGLRGAILVWLLVMLTMAAIYAGFFGGVIPPPTEILTRLFDPATLIASWLGQMMISGAVGGAVALVVQRLWQSHTAAEAARADLQRLNAELEQRVAERTAALAASEEKYRVLFENAGFPIVLYDIEGRVILINEQAARMLGGTPADLIGRTLHELFPPDRVEPYLARIQQVIATGRPEIREEQTVHPVEPRWFWTGIYPVFDTSGRAVAVQVIAYDTTERRQADKQIRFQARLLDEVGQAIVVTAPDGTIVYWNRAAETLYGWQADDVLGYDILDITSADETREHGAEIMQQLRAGQRWSGEFLARRRDGTTFLVFATDVPISNEHGELTHIIGISADITALKQAEAALRASEEKFRGFLEQSWDSIVLTDPAGTVIAWNHAAEQAMGLPQAEALGRPIWDVLYQVAPPEHQTLEVYERLRTHTLNMLQTGQTPWSRDGIERTAVHPDGTQRALRSLIFPIYTSEGILAGSISNDITERKQMEQALSLRLRQSEALRETLNQITGELQLEPLLQTILDRAVDLLSAASGQIAMYDAEQNDLQILACTNLDPALVGTRQPLTSHGTGQVIRTYQPLVISDYQTWDERLATYAKLGAHALLLVPLLAGERVLGIISIGHSDPSRTFNSTDIELLSLFAQQATIAIRNAHQFAEMQHLATTDSLTGLNNRRSFGNLAQRAYEQAVRYNHPLAVLMLDIDHFKRVNDQFGHGAGDHVLRSVAYYCLTSLRAVDVVGRYGGEEIAMILPETDSGQAHRVAERLRQTLAQASIETEYGSLQITVSLGIATATPQDSLPLETLINRADQALYQAKRAGRNRVVVWQPTAEA
jgi:diguanylate cyclase (GGDEF)-like protein/PAS domain S-box-containing protein